MATCVTFPASIAIPSERLFNPPRPRKGPIVVKGYRYATVVNIAMDVPPGQEVMSVGNAASIAKDPRVTDKTY